MATANRASKGTVQVEDLQGRLRLRWRYEGLRYALSVGLPDSKVNRKVAQRKAHLIELDIVSGNFDPTLKKYKTHIHTQHTQITVVALFKGFIEYKAKGIYLRSLEKYQATIGYLSQFFKEKPALLLALTKLRNLASG